MNQATVDYQAGDRPQAIDLTRRALAIFEQLSMPAETKVARDNLTFSNPNPAAPDSVPRLEAKVRSPHLVCYRVSVLPEFSAAGDLPAGVHRTTWDEFRSRFGSSTLRRAWLFGR